MPNALDTACSLKLMRSCDDEEHTPLRQGLERAEQFGGGQWAEPRALRSAGAGSLDVADRITFGSSPAATAGQLLQRSTQR